MNIGPYGRREVGEAVATGAIVCLATELIKLGCDRLRKYLEARDAKRLAEKSADA
jgi:hypothetical protein